MQITILTPSLCRGNFLQMLRKMLDAQTIQGFTHIILEEDWSYEENKVDLPGSKFHILPTENKSIYSLSAKMNIGLNLPEVLNSDIIFKMDSDNYFGSQYIEKYLSFMDNNPECMLTFSQREYLYNIVEREYGMLEVIQDGNICCRRQLLDKVKFRESFGVGDLGEDAFFIWDTESAFGQDAKKQHLLDIEDYMVIKHSPKIQEFHDYKSYKPYVYPKDIAIQKIQEGRNLCTYDVSNISDIDCLVLQQIVKDPIILEFYKEFYKP